MTANVLVRLSGDENAGAAMFEELVGANIRRVRLADLLRLRKDLAGGHLGILGTPPDRQIGYGLLTLFTLLARPAHVSELDTAVGNAKTRGLVRFLIGSVRFAVPQLVVSAAALAVQWGLVVALRILRRPMHVRAGGLDRVLYLRPHSGITASAGGSVTHAHGVIRALRDRGVHVQPFTTDELVARTASDDPDPPCRWIVKPVPRAFGAVPASAALGSDVALFQSTRRAARRASLVYQRHSRFSLVGALVACVGRCPFFLEYNDGDAVFNRNVLTRRMRRCEQAALRAADRVIVVSETSKELLAQRGVRGSKIVVAPNGVDVHRFDTGGGAMTRDELGIGHDRLLIGFVGSFGPWHGAPVLARAFSSLAERNSSIDLLLIGDGVEHEETVRLVGGIRDRVHVLPYVAPTEVPRHLDACDVLVSPHVELAGGVPFFGSPTKLFEYMAARKAIVASALGQIADVLDHNRTALLVPPGDQGALVSAIARLIGDAGLREKLGTNARRDAESLHSWGQNAERIATAYRSLVGGGDA